MRKKLLASCIAGLGILCIAIGVFQLNQYYTTSAAASQTLQQLDELSASADLSGTGLTAADLAQTREATENTLNSLVLSALADFALGVILFLGGYLLYPRENN
ncbi:MAG: hypothetical protein AB1626_00750 [Candidatus Micrarchaeota archaeon]